MNSIQEYWTTSGSYWFLKCVLEFRKFRSVSLCRQEFDLWSFEITAILQNGVLFPRGGGIQAIIWQGCSSKTKCQILQKRKLLKIQMPQKLSNRKFIAQKMVREDLFPGYFKMLYWYLDWLFKLILLFEYKNWKTPKIARTVSTPTLAKNDTKIWQSPRIKFSSISNPPKWEEHACLNFEMPLPPPWPSHVYFSTLVGYISDFQGPPASKSKLQSSFQFTRSVFRVCIIQQKQASICRDHLRSNFGQFRDNLGCQDHFRSWD